MAQSILETYRKAVLDSGITGKDWRKTDAFDEFSVFYNATYSEEQRKSMNYKSILKICTEWWSGNSSKYS